MTGEIAVINPVGGGGSMVDAEAPALVARALTHRYGRGRRLSLGPLDLELSQPGITGLVGPNGAGKSTLLKVWAGLERPSSGTASVCGFDAWRERASSAGMFGYVPQVPALYRTLTVEQHLRLARLERPGFDSAASRHYLSELRVPLDAKGGELSGGQRAQLTLAIALGTHARVLLLDEPLASLDPLARRDFLTILADAVREAGALALLSSHVVTDIEQSCDRLIVLGQGRVLVQGPIDELVRTHGVRPPREAERPGATPIATFAGRQGQTTLVRVKDGSLADRAGEQAASLEDIVVGYLTLGRDQ